MLVEAMGDLAAGRGADPYCGGVQWPVRPRPRGAARAARRGGPGRDARGVGAAPAPRGARGVGGG